MSNHFTVEQVQHVEHPNNPFIYNQHTTQQHTCGSLLEDRLSILEIKVDNIGTEIININTMLNDIYNRCNEIVETQKQIVDMNNLVQQKLDEFDCEKEE
jgi:hypothetical protein